MASGVRMLVAGLSLIANTIVIMMFALAGGAVFGPIYAWYSLNTKTGGPIPTNLVQWFPGVFFGLLILLELVLIYVTYQAAIVSTQYSQEY
jgi:hypothetical protein